MLREVAGDVKRGRGCAGQKWQGHCGFPWLNGAAGWIARRSPLPVAPRDFGGMTSSVVSCAEFRALAGKLAASPALRVQALARLLVCSFRSSTSAGSALVRRGRTRWARYLPPGRPSTWSRPLSHTTPRRSAATSTDRLPIPAKAMARFDRCFADRWGGVPKATTKRWPKRLCPYSSNLQP